MHALPPIQSVTKKEKPEEDDDEEDARKHKTRVFQSFLVSVATSTVAWIGLEWISSDFSGSTVFWA